MPDISYYTIGTTQYNLKDLVSRERISTLENWVASAIDMFYPIGSVIINFGVDPGTYLEDTTWEETAVGKAIVGVDPNSSVTNMQTAGGTFGESDTSLPSHNHTGTTAYNTAGLTANSNGNHRHSITNNVWRNTSYRHLKKDGDQGYPWGTYYTDYAGAHTHSIDAHTHSFSTANTGTSVTNKNYQPSMAFHIWKRIA